MTLTAVLIALGIGAALGLLGGGGSIVAVPLLTMVAHFSAKDAVTASLAIVGVAAAAGAISGLVRGVLPMRIALVVGVAATIGSTAGSAIGARMPDQLQLGILGVVMLLAALVMWRRPALSASKKTTTRLPVLGVIGISVGMLTGMVGVGGGFLIVPALAIAAHLPMPKAAAASLFVIALAAASAIPNYISHTTLAWPFIAGFALTAAAGSVVGGLVAPRLPQRVLQKAFAITLVILGSYVLLQA